MSYSTRVHATGFYQPKDWSSPRGRSTTRHINILADDWSTVYRLEIEGGYGQYTARLVNVTQTLDRNLLVLQVSLPDKSKLKDAKRAALLMAHACIELDPRFKYIFK